MNDSNHTLLQGIWIPATTPFADNGSVDAGLFVAHCKWLIANGAAGIAPFGTTSEGNSLSASEKQTLLQALLAAGVPAAQLMPGTGACALPDAVAQTRAAVDAGCAAALVLPPFYYKAAINDDGLFAFFNELIEQVGSNDLRICLYHIPPVAQVGFSLALIERLLARHGELIVGLKDSSGNFEYTRSVLAAFPQLRVFAGSESFLLDTLRAGGAGCITATGNLNIRAISHVHARSEEADAPDLQQAITRRRRIVEGYPVIPAIKAALAQLHGAASWANVRAPLLPLEVKARGAVLDALAADGWAGGARRTLEAVA
ncbi:MAG: dihydrodipicolinate synthase family protein [Burkholderiaceae bacterium]